MVFGLLVSFSLPGLARDFGSTGLITMPTADLLPQSYLNLNYSRIWGSESEDKITFAYGLKDDIQLGGRLAWYQQSRDLEAYPGFKINLWPEEGDYRPMVSVGASGWDQNLYVAASRYLHDYDFRVHLGVGDQGIFEDYIGLGLSKVLNPVLISTDNRSLDLPRIKVKAEYNSSMNLGLEFKFGPGIELELGVVDLNDFTFGLGFENKF